MNILDVMFFLILSAIILVVSIPVLGLIWTWVKIKLNEITEGMG